MLRFILYSRSYCHLCEDMRAALAGLQLTMPYALDVVDVDADPDLVARYDELVPVLLGVKASGEAMQLCHYFLDEAAVRAFAEAAQ